jgi:hypothetical protein
VSNRIPELRATSCADALSKLAESLGGDGLAALRNAKVAHVDISGDTATARVEGGTATAQLVKRSGSWFISGGLF